MPTIQNKPTYTVILQPVGRRTEIHTGNNLLEAAQQAGVELASLCGGIGACDSCKVRLESGLLSAPTLEEEAAFSPAELKAGFRLACQSFPLSDIKIEIPPESLTTPQRLQLEGQDTEVAPDPAVRAVDVLIEAPTIHDLRSDATRTFDALRQGGYTKNPSLHPALLGDFSSSLRLLDWQPRLALRGEQIAAILPAGTSLHGLAVDMGTTKLAAYLVNLESGATLAKTGGMNPQIAYGEDVISRISYADSRENGRQTLQQRMASAINELVAGMCAATGSRPEQIVDAVVVGNTAMHHLFAGLPVQQLGASPYVPAIGDPLDLSAQSLGLNLSSGAQVHLPANIAGYVGADHIAMLLATGVPETQATVLAVDIGTNTEITLTHKGRMVACSCASGPAFEGAHIRDGMRAAPGAIERVQIAGQQVRLQTIGEQPPVGICGSGILDAVSEMRRAGLLDARGALDKNHPLVSEENGRSRFVLAPAGESGHGRAVAISRHDVNKIQLAKGAIRAGIDILLQESGIQASQLERFIVAGAFGTYISIEAAVRVGMFPDLPLERFHQVGNAAGAGARQMLVSMERRRFARAFAPRVAYVELSAHPDFIHAFSHALFFPGSS